MKKIVFITILLFLLISLFSITYANNKEILSNEPSLGSLEVKHLLLVENLSLINNLREFSQNISNNINEVNKEVEFESEALKKYILENYDVDNDGKITTYDMSQIRKLYISKPISSLKGLEYAINLEELRISANLMNLDNIEPLKNLINLNILSISRNMEHTQNKALDYSVISNLCLLQNLNIEDDYSTIDINYLSKMELLCNLSLEVKEIENSNLIENHTNI